MPTDTRGRFAYNRSGSRQALVAVAWLCAAVNCQIGRAAAYEPGVVSNGGTIEGVVSLGGKPPALEPIKVTKNQDYCGTSIPSPVYVVGKNGGLQGRAIQGRLTVNPILTNRGCPL